VRLAVLAGAAAGATAAAALRLLRAAPPLGAQTWNRTNHAGQAVSLLEGPAYVVGAAAGTALLGAGAGPVVATVAAGWLGALDDLAGDSNSKGLKGHLGALRRGEVTTGAVKILGLGASGLLAAALVDRQHPAVHRPHALDTVVGGAVIAGSANLLNLLDLRPGRALKATLLLGTLLAARGPEAALRTRAAAYPEGVAPAGFRHAPGVAPAAAAGAALGLLGPDLAGETMLGDTGANSAGALLGTALVARCGSRGRIAALAVLAGLTLASERVSFTRIIESTPGLRELDALGRR
jgi:UDP-N-acetylmuramyl pentapeptide phosphotransferase/UDP-N-acetylglucosamine-1-phosphate transferase